MSRSEGIKTTFWDEQDDLSNDAMLTSLWSTTTVRCNMAGVFRCPRRHLVEGRVPDDGRLQAALDELEDRGLVYYRESVLWNRERAGLLTTKTVQMAKSIAKSLLEVKNNPIYPAFVSEYRVERLPWLTEKLQTANNPDFTPLIDDLFRASGEGHASLIRPLGEVPDLAETSQVVEGQVNLTRASIDGATAVDEDDGKGGAGAGERGR